jgi:hypothetical protein
VWKPFNGITLGQTETNWFQYPTDTKKRMSFNVHYVWKSNLGLAFLDKFDSVNRLIPLTLITLSGTHWTINVVKSSLKIGSKETLFVIFFSLNGQILRGFKGLLSFHLILKFIQKDFYDLFKHRISFKKIWKMFSMYNQEK